MAEIPKATNQQWDKVTPKARKCEWRTAPSGAFSTTCGFLTEWKIPDLDRYSYCPFCARGLKIIPE